MIGQEVGSYRITAAIGAGGMGAVYAAEHKLIGRKAAVKMLLPELSHKPEIVTRFFNEAKAATAIKHPGIVEIYDFGYHASGSAFIVMEFLEGESLQDRIRRVGRMPQLQALSITGQVASALAAAHQAGIVHRDLKPDNVFLVPDPDIVGGERATILDFGIAKLSDDQSTGSVKTRTGSLMGTPTYMSPEQCKGAGQVDARSDLYSVGCILYELLIGWPPFVAEGVGEVMAQHIYEPAPSLRTTDPAIAVEVDTLVAQLLAKDPGQRPQTALAVKQAADQLSGRASVPPAAHAPTAAMATAPSGRVPHTPTTLSSAAGVAQSPVTDITGRRPGWIAPAVAGAILAVAGVVFALTRGGDGPEVASADPPGPVHKTPAAEPAAEPPAEPPPATQPRDPVAEPPAPEPKPDPPAKITLTIASKPAGAVVYRQPHGNRLGKTPLTYEMDPLDGQIEFLLKKRGYRDVDLAMSASEDGESRVVMKKRSRRSSSREAPPAGDPPGKLNPFDKKDKLNPFDKKD